MADCCAHGTRRAGAWRPARRARDPTAAKASVVSSTSGASEPARARPKPSVSALTLVINLERRPDRIAALHKLKLGFAWERLDAVDGRALSWDALGAGGSSPYAGLVQADAIREAAWAAQHNMPTICRRTGSFSPHLTLGAVGVALSQRKAWQKLLECADGGPQHALIMEDDIATIAPDFSAQLARLLKALPSTWHICFLGYHESTGRLLPASRPPRPMELPNGTCVTGLYAYLVHRRGARALLASGGLFPLRHQIDVAASQFAWPRAARFALDPEGVLMTSPKSEEGKCDTDIQTLGAPTERAHASLPRTMLRL